jgi:hypothetical protein
VAEAGGEKSEALPVGEPLEGARFERHRVCRLRRVEGVRVWGLRLAKNPIYIYECTYIHTYLFIHICVYIYM